MDQRPLGSTGLSVSRLSLGTVKLGRNTSVKYPTEFELPNDEAVRSLFHIAQDIGINTIDTAPAYGTSEERVGQLLPGNRDDWIICTKAGEEFDGEGSSYDFSDAAITQSVHRSMKRLRTEYLDLVLIHSDGNDLEIIEQSDAIAALDKLKTAGFIRAFGISTKTVEGSMAALPLVDVLMLTLNLQDQSHLGMIEEAAKQQRGVLLKKVLESGHGDVDDNLKFALSQPGVSSAVIGTINPQHLIANAETTKRI